MEPITSRSASTNEQGAPALGFCFGICLLVVAGGGFYFSGKIESIGFQDPSDPGPRFFPQTLLFFLAISGMLESIIHGRRWRRRSLEKRRSLLSNEGSAEPVEALKLGYLMIGFTWMVLFVLGMPWTGFPLASILFLAVLMPLLGIPWKLAVIYAFGMTGVIWVVFVWGLQAPLPRGVMW